MNKLAALKGWRTYSSIENNVAEYGGPEDHQPEFAQELLISQFPVLGIPIS